MLTQEQQAALGGYRPQDKPQLPPPSGSTFRPLPQDIGTPNVVKPVSPTGSIGMVGDFLLIALLGMLG